MYRFLAKYFGRVNREGGESREPANREPLRAELFTPEQLSSHARGLAHRLTTGGSPKGARLLERLDDNEKKLHAFNRSSLAVDSSPGHLTPAAEWLLDNFYLIEDQIKMARRHLPRQYVRSLPCLSEGVSIGLPRIYELVLELILHVDAQIDSVSLNSFVEAFQSVCPLNLGELWAIPIMLRLGLIENLQRITARQLRAREDEALAEYWVDRLQKIAEEDPSRLVIVVAEMAKADTPLSSSFVAEFCQILSRQSPALHPARAWLEQRLGEHGMSIELLSRQENQEQAADQVSVSHSIACLRFLGAMNWKQFVEEQSRIESALRRDPAGVYASMDFTTRDRYRRVVEALARYSGIAEPEVAQMAINLAESETGNSKRSGHVGYYLIGKGLPEMESATQVRWPLRRLAERLIHDAPLTFYIGGIAAISLLVASTLVWQLRSLGVGGGLLFLSAVVLVVGFSQMAVALMNWFSALLIEPKLLPRMDFSAGIEAVNRTMVAVPTMLKSQEGIGRLIESLEIHYFANRDPHLHFALLTDFADAPQERMPEDEALIEQTRDGIERLNRKYAPQQNDRFYLFHRPRKWNAGEGVWMGFERKRGKLAAFNSYLRGGEPACFSTIVGEGSILPSIRYVITLDTDTVLPREAAWKMVGTMSHPLNRPVIDPVRGVVVEGYGILQPRMGVSLAGARDSLFVRMVSGDVGMDPYTRQVSDVYQDLFSEGSFVGKGIYDVDVFRQVTEGSFPDNSVLSHDLLEGCYVRSGLLSDVELYESHPSQYNVDVDRRHRWIRGDWQIVQWLMPRVAGSSDCRSHNPLSALSRWKIFDNLRRSFVPTALILILAGGWFLPVESLLSVLVVITISGLPAALKTLSDFLFKPIDRPWSIHLRGLVRDGGRQAGQILLSLVLLPYEVFINLHAVALTLYRLVVTRKRLLQWQTSGDAEAKVRAGFLCFYRTMWTAPAVAIAVAVFLVVAEGSPAIGVILLGLWVAAPGIAWCLSRPIRNSKYKINQEQSAFLRRSARRHWHYFETFVTAEQNWLPPDNMQEVPQPRVASRTSPTNMGLALLANLAAWDFGYLTSGGLIQRTRDSLSTMQGLQRHRNHFYNWYDTRTLQPMEPLYVSSVDSGNLAGHLLTLSAGLREQADESILSQNVIAGLHDTATILASVAGESPILSRLIGKLASAPVGMRATYALLEWATAEAKRLEAWVVSKGEEALDWAQVLHRNGKDACDELRHLAPWLLLPAGTRQESAQNDAIPTLRELAHFAEALQEPAAFAADTGKEAAFQEALRLGVHRATIQMSELEKQADQCETLAAMDFDFLYDTARRLFITGFNVGEWRCDPGHYDLLASEARQCSYIAIALGQVPQAHWFSLGRLLVASVGNPVLASWSGSMFEYLMPLLIMPNFENTLLDHTCHAAVRQQIEYARLRGVPWGISESAYNRTDADLNYQYRAFGVPGMGLQRGLTDDLVIAPYATVLALMVEPREACENLQRLAAEGREGRYGYYEAVDYTPSRLPPDESSVTIRSFMVHHQGMSLLALDHVLLSAPMPRRFRSCPQLKATELLLQERVPKMAVSILSENQRLEPLLARSESGQKAVRRFSDPHSSVPEIHLLSNGRYHVAISSAGAGYSRWGRLALTRWREDATCDGCGMFVYLQDAESGESWSTAHQPTRCFDEHYEASFNQASAEFRVHRKAIEVHTRINVSPEDDIEVRRIKVCNHSPHESAIILTSYAEVVLAPQSEDEAHPAFSNLFVQTEFLPESSAILATRRARTAEEQPPWLLHMMLDSGISPAEISCETDRCRFIGRTGSLAHPAAMATTGTLSNTVGSVLDPVAALRRRVILPAHGEVIVYVILGVAESRQKALAIIEKYQGARMAERAFDLAWVHSQVILHQLDASESDVQLYSRMASALVYANPALRAHPTVLANNHRGKSGLWSYGISGDTPIVLLRVNNSDGMELVRQLIRAHAYWRLKGLAIDLIIVNETVSVYHEALHRRIIDQIVSGPEAHLFDKAGGIFVRNLDQLPNDDHTLMQASARIVLDDKHGTLVEQVAPHRIVGPFIPPLSKSSNHYSDSLKRAIGVINERDGGLIREAVSDRLPARDLIFNNALGGFTRDGNEYVITLRAGQSSPMPWVNVIANPYFGTLVSESGAAYTWVENAHEFRLTPWHNDPVEDPTGEAFYIRDEESGNYWSPSPSPARGLAPYVIRHGFGYSVFEHTEDGIVSELWVYVARDAPVKYSVLKCRNISGRPRRLSVTSYCEWVLGNFRRNSLLHIKTELDAETGALLAKNPYNTDFAERIAFIDVQDSSRTQTGNRNEFIGRNGSLAHPAALGRARLSGKVGAGLDPCGAVQVAFVLAVGEERETRFRLGVGRSRAEVHGLILRFRETGIARRTLEEVWEYWNRTLGAINVDTPDASVNTMANGWLLYQTLSSRMWGRTGFYQSGGAYGFRDQLQDSMALIHAEPSLVREHLLRAAARQFREGDVQHWWHPPMGRGVRTKFSDDFLWLPFVTCHYVTCVGDTGVLDEAIPFLESRPLRPDEESLYELPNRSEESASIYHHCVRAIEHGLRFGEHGLPLMGGGDWNDGMNRVGHEGCGESVWLGFFLYDVLQRFAKLADACKDPDFAAHCRSSAAELEKNISTHAWDGKWYRRAYFDDGTPLGSRSNEECQIDSLPQSWAVLSGAGDARRAQQAMESVVRRLVRRDVGIIQLFDPPFDKSAPNPGYIKGYSPGVRENGGQYTHAAIWVAMALAQMGETEQAWDLFRLLNPINHGGTPEGIATYKAEPYVIAADVYGVAPHTGRGGWSWYTGSAAWMYRLLTETLLGVHREGDRLRLIPRPPPSWDHYSIHYRFYATVYHIHFNRIPAELAAAELTLDDEVMHDNTMPLENDLRDHTVKYSFR